MAQYKAPGVYVEETHDGTETIVGVPTSITAFVGRAPRGAVGKPVRVSHFGEYDAEFGGPWTPSTLGPAVQQFFAQGGTEALVVRVLHDRAGREPDRATARAARATIGAGEELTLTAASEGSWGNQLSVAMAIVAAAGSAEEESRFDLTVVDGGTGGEESFADLSADPDDPRFVTSVLAGGSRLVRVGDVSGAPTGSSTSAVIFAGGTDGAPVTVQDVLGDPVRRTGIRALDEADLFNLLCIPPLLDEDLAEIDAGPLWPPAARYCAERRAFLLVDPPATWRSHEDARGAIKGLASRIGPGENAALYFPRLVTKDPLTRNGTRELAPGGAIAGVIARTDARRGVWKAPAGVEATLVGVEDLASTLDSSQHDILNQLAVNCLRDLPGPGHVVWGARTLAGAVGSGSEWTYVPVRRLALYLEESIHRGTEWTVFEPNDEPSWGRVRLSVGAFLNGLFRQGAFAGAKPEEAYFVKCDAETNTQSDIEAGILNFLVGFAPLKPAEFVVLRFRHQSPAASSPGTGIGRRDPQSVLGAFGLHVDPRARWDDLVLPARPRQLLRAMVEEVRHRASEFDDRGFAALFTGPRGTGKTLAAEILAGDLGVPLYRIDLSTVVTKYIGETEKNLQRLFDAATEIGAVLFFDEADALLGKRTQVRDAHDRYANLETAYFLQCIEAHRGIVILASNRRSNIDEAFSRRLRHVVPFPFPDPPARRRIWKRVLRDTAQGAKLEVSVLAASELSGGDIRNAARRAASLAAAQGDVTQEQVLEAIRTELARARRAGEDRRISRRPPSD